MRSTQAFFGFFNSIGTALFFSSALLLSCTLFLSCTGIGYLGPERSPAEVSNVSVHTSGEVTVNNIAIDGNGFGVFASSMDVLPGTHKLTTNYRAELESCFSSDDLCDVDVVSGSCEGEVTTKPGKPYLVTVAEKAGQIEARLAAKSYFEFNERSDESAFGQVNCREISRYKSYRSRRK